MNKILLEIVTPENIVYTDEVDMVVVPSASGTMVILARHTPLFAQLVEGELKIKKENETNLCIILFLKSYSPVLASKFDKWVFNS